MKTDQLELRGKRGQWPEALDQHQNGLKLSICQSSNTDSYLNTNLLYLFEPRS